MYVETMTGYLPDQLLVGTDIPVRLHNVNVADDNAFKRGDLICAPSMSGAFAPVSAAADASKILMIAASDFTPDDEHTVTQAYSSGLFNRENINVGELDISDFEQELRKQNIILTSQKG